MATKARQQYFADENSLKKDKREFSIADEIQQKIDSIEEGAQVNKIETVKVNGTALVPDAYKAVNVDVPDVIDNLYTVAADDALSAKQGKLLYDYIQNLQTIGRFLSNWDSATGLPITNPSESPYLYKAGDYYRVSNVAVSPALNYKPNGSSFIIGQASTTVETNNIDISDLYLYDGTTWILLSNSGSSIAVDSSLSTTSTNPVENRVITNALNGKQETLIAGSNIQIAADGKTISATDTTYSAGANISIDANNEISAVDTTYTAGTNVQISNQNVISATDTKYSAGTGINIDANNEISNTLPGAIVSATAPSNPTEGMVWYDTTNDSLKAYNGTSWETEGTKMVVLEYGVSTWQDFLNAYNENAVVYCRASSNSDPSTGSQTRMAFMAYVNNQTNPTEVEFQYYRSRSSHSTAANVLDEVYVYKLVSSGGGTWTVTQRDTAAKPIAGTGIGLTFNASGMTISADTSVLATKTYVDEHDTVVSSTAPASPTEGMVWYDTTNDELKVYDGTDWKATGSEYNAGEGISIGSVVINGRQGPAPEGFHVPSVDEWAGLKDIMDNVSLSSGNDWKTNLYMPFSGHRYDDGSIDVQGTEGYYWSSTPLSGTGIIDESSYNLLIATTGNAKPREYNIRSYGLSIRCFKDTPVEIENPLNPGGDWDLINNVGLGFYIFHSPSLGVITIMSRNSGREYITIADKNLGATTVYNDGDTLSEANCGKYYQWGNNYGFSWTGAITTSSTQVDASGYGPGNYYSSDTFITGYADWSSVRNPDLWGDTTGTITQDNVIKNTGVLSVNGQTGDVTVQAVLNQLTSAEIKTGTATTDSSVTASALAGAVPVLSTQANNLLTSGMKIWAGTEADYQNLGSYDQNTLYLTI